VPKKSSQPVTLSAVARHAGVSVATVSYVLNGVQESRIPENTRARVQESIRALGYVPNANARSLRVGRSDLVVVHLLGGLPMLQRAAAGLDQVSTQLRAAGFTLMIHSDASLRGAEAARHWSALRPAALLTDAGFLDAASLAQVQAAGSIAIAVAHDLDPKKPVTMPTIVFDHAAVGETAVQHLIERGCREIMLIEPQHPGARVIARQRKRGAQRAARATKGVRLSTAELPFDPRAAAEVVASWNKGSRPDGVFAFDDDHAGLLLGALTDRGWRVPQQIGLVGSDNSSFCEMLRPRLTSTSIDVESVAESMVEPILGAIEGRWREGVSERPWRARLHPRET
jgi:DNA-binding LacI/PurR family transcriptional regulator